MITKVSTVNAPPVPVAPTHTSRPTPQDIAVRAHQIFEERGGIPGSDLEDWLRAERELILAANLTASAQKSVQSAKTAANPRPQK